MNIGEKIQEILDWRGMQQKELAKRTGLPVATVNGYITKGRNVPAEALNKIAHALDISILTLLNEEPMPVHPEEMTEREEKILGEYRCLTHKQRDLINHGVMFMLQQNKEP